MLGVRTEEPKENCSKAHFAVIVYPLDRRDLASSLCLWMNSGHLRYSIVKEASVFHNVSMPAVNAPVSFHSLWFHQRKRAKAYPDLWGKRPKDTPTTLGGGKIGFPYQKGNKPEKCYLPQRPLKVIIQQKVRISTTFLPPFKVSKKQWDAKGRGVQVHRSRIRFEYVKDWVADKHYFGETLSSSALQWKRHLPRQHCHSGVFCSTLMTEALTGSRGKNCVLQLAVRLSPKNYNLVSRRFL